MDRAVIVSGGGTGIGRAVARRFAADGDRVLLVGRREAVLRQAAEALTEKAPAADGEVRGEIRTLAADLTRPEEAARGVRDRDPDGDRDRDGDRDPDGDGVRAATESAPVREAPAHEAGAP